MLITLLIALGLRLPFLTQSLWLDESLQALALMGRMGPLLEYSLSDFQPPLYHLLTYPFHLLTGYSEIALRTPSLLFSLLSIYAVYLIARAIHNRKSATIAALLLATNPLHIYYSQEARSYMLTALLFSFSMLYFIKLTNSESSKKNIILYLIFTSLSLWSSYTVWFGVFAQTLILLFNKEHRHLLKTNLFSYLTFIPWIKPLFTQLGIGLSTLRSSPLWGDVVGGSGLREIALTWLKFQVGRVSFDNDMLYLGVALALLIIHILITRKSKPNRTLLTILLLAPSIALLVSAFIPIYQYFRVLYLLPLYTIILANALSKFKPSATLFMIVINLLFLAYYWVTPRFHKEDWRAALTSVTDQAKGNWALTLPSIAQNAPIKYYFPLAKSQELRSLDSPLYDQIFYFKYAEDLFDPQAAGPSNAEKLGYRITRELSFPGGIHLIVYTNANEDSN